MAMRYDYIIYDTKGEESRKGFFLNQDFEIEPLRHEQIMYVYLNNVLIKTQYLQHKEKRKKMAPPITVLKHTKDSVTLFVNSYYYGHTKLFYVNKKTNEINQEYLDSYYVTLNNLEKENYLIYTIDLENKESEKRTISIFEDNLKTRTLLNTDYNISVDINNLDNENLYEELIDLYLKTGETTEEVILEDKDINIKNIANIIDIYLMDDEENLIENITDFTIKDNTLVINENRYFCPNYLFSLITLLLLMKIDY